MENQLIPRTPEAEVAWIKALMKEGILVAEPKDLAGIRNKLIEEAKREAKERILGIVGQEVKFAMRQELTKLPSVKEQEHVSYNLISRLRLALKQKHLGG